MDTSLENQIFIDVFLTEHYDYAALRKGLLIALFVKLFKTTNLGKPYLQMLLPQETICLSIAFLPNFSWWNIKYVAH